jgi:5-methyltetrahydropteroyltriglutamate--homocysteine methyltransferase
MTVLSTCLGYPRIGLEGELELALARYRQKKATASELEEIARTLTSRNWATMRRAGIDHVPCNDFSLHDHVLDTAVLLGLIPERHRAIACPIARSFAMARGLVDDASGVHVLPLATGKWFDTDYRHLVPELAPGMTTQLDVSKPMEELDAARSLDVAARPVVLGPVSFLLLSRMAPTTPEGRGTLDFLETVLEAYAGLFTLLSEEGVSWVQLDEPCLVGSLDAAQETAYRDTFARLASLTSRPRVMLTTYFGALRHNLPLALASGFEGLHVDLVRAPDQLDDTLSSLPARMTLSVGLVDGQHSGHTDLGWAGSLLRRAVARLGTTRVWVASSCSLLHVPNHYEHTHRPIMSPLVCAMRKLDELRTLAESGGRTSGAR